MASRAANFNGNTQKLRIHVDPDLEEFLPKYYQNRLADLARLNAFLARSDYDSIQKISHKIRGHATSYGMDPLGEICKRMEAAATERDLCAIENLIFEFKTYLKRVEIP